MPELLDQSNIEIIKAVISQVSFSSIADKSDTLLDKDSPTNPTQLENFFKETQLKDLVFEDIEDPRFFTLRNLQNGQTITVSNRTGAVELRGSILRNLLNNKKQENENQTIEEAILGNIKSPKAEEIQYLKPPFTEGSNAIMSPEQFDLFIELAFRKFNENIDRLGITRDSENKEEAWRDIDLQEIFKRTSLVVNLNYFLNHMNKKADEWSEKNAHKPEYLNAFNEVSDLTERLNKQKNEILHGDFNASADRCIEIIKTAEGALEKHRGVLGQIFNKILQVLNTLTSGAVEVKPTHSIQVTQQMKNWLQSQKSSDAEEPPETPRL